MCAQHSAPASAELAMNPELSSNRIVLYKTDFDPDFVEREEDEQEPHCSYDPIDLSGLGLESLPSEYFRSPNGRWSNPLAINSLNLSDNQIVFFPLSICRFSNLISLDMSNNQLVSLPEEMGDLCKLKQLFLRNNILEELPKRLQLLVQLEELNLSGNMFEQISPTLFQLVGLKKLYLGGNRLEILYLGGNRLEEVPASLGRLKKLVALALSDNRLQSLPTSFADLRSLRSLSLHNNRIKVLPTGIARLRQLEHLSLRNNPLVTDFVNETEAPPTLKELAGRVVKIKLPAPVYSHLLPRDLSRYLDSANRCVNPKCKGVYFESCAELVKFVDFCGKYRVPLLHYLCSTKCSAVQPAYAGTSSSESDEEQLPSTSRAKMQKILLG